MRALGALRFNHHHHITFLTHPRARSTVVCGQVRAIACPVRLIPALSAARARRGTRKAPYVPLAPTALGAPLTRRIAQRSRVPTVHKALRRPVACPAQRGGGVLAAQLTRSRAIAALALCALKVMCVAIVSISGAGRLKTLLTFRAGNRFLLRRWRAVSRWLRVQRRAGG